jgi:O-antigen/teichoic acid export membrane protein
MKTIKRVAKNTSFLFAGDIVVRLLGLLLVVSIARELGAGEYGKYAFAIAFTSLFLILADLGLSTISTRDIARDSKLAPSYVTTVPLIKLVFSIAAMGLIAIIINALEYPPDTVKVVYIVGLLYTLESFGAFYRSIFRAFERMEYDAVSIITERLLVVGAGLVFLFHDSRLIVVVLAMLAAQAFGFVFTISLCTVKFTRPKLPPDLSIVKPLIKTAIPFALAGVFDRIVFQTDLIMLSTMKGDIVAGWYGVAQRPLFAILFIPSIITAAIFPAISKFAVSSNENLSVAYEKSLKFLTLLATPICIGTIMISHRIILFLYGEGFINSEIVLKILAFAVAILFLVIFTGHTLVSINRQIIAMRVSGIGALLNVALNFGLIPAMSYVGAAIASAVSVTIILVIQFVYLQKHLCNVNLPKLVAKPLLAAVIMGILVYLLDKRLSVTTVNLLLIIGVAIIIYGLQLLLLQVLDKREVGSIKEIFRRKDPNS